MLPAVQQFLSRRMNRFWALAAAFFVSSVPAFAGPQQLTREEVELIVAQAATEASRRVHDAIIAVTDREGFVLAIWSLNDDVPRTLPPFDITLNNRANVKLYALIAGAITRASTAAFLSSDQNAFTSRTAGFIIQQHFPPGVRNTPNGPLVGVGFSSLFFTDVNRVKIIPQQVLAGTTPVPFNGATPIDPTQSPGVRAPLFPLTSLNDSPGGVPLYKGGHLVGGIGVTGDDSPSNLAPAGAILFKETQPFSTPGFKTGSDDDELVALAGQTNFRPRDEIVATNILINGIRIPYVDPRLEEIEDVRDVQPLGSIGMPVDVPVIALPVDANVAAAVLVPPSTLRAFSLSDVLLVPPGTVASGSPQASPNVYPYEVARLGSFEGEIRFPFRDDPRTNDPNPRRRKIAGKVGRLTALEVEEIISLAAHRALITRAGIRIPIGTSVKVFISVVSNPDRPGEPADILGVFRTGEATVFSWDVAVQKARTAVFFSNTQLAMSSRSVGFLAQRFFPPGIDGTSHGPYFGFQEAVTLRRSPKPFLKGPFPGLPADLVQALNGLPPFFPGNPNLTNGITIFPGGFPLYRDGFLVGAIGISGDGVDQDDIIGISGTEDFRPKPSIRADSFNYRGARLPYVKFPRDPERGKRHSSTSGIEVGVAP